MGTVISFIVTVAIVIIIAKIVFKGTAWVIGFLINAAVGAVALWILDLLGVGLPINWITAGVVGLLGVPGVILLLLLKYVFKLF